MVQKKLFWGVTIEKDGFYVHFCIL